jgi:hypothetical protein
MYWFKTLCSRHHLFGGYWMIMMTAIIIALSSCKPEVKETKNTLQYFDIKGYFRADSARLSAKHGSIIKTVTHNGVTQTKKVKIDNWGRELELFINSDINKPAWRASYSVSTGKDIVVYEAKVPGLKTRRILIGRNGGRIKWILIFNHTKNLLYENVEKLTYFPDSVYQIEKSQKVRLLGKNIYSVKGVFN